MNHNVDICKLYNFHNCYHPFFQCDQIGACSTTYTKRQIYVVGNAPIWSLLCSTCVPPMSDGHMPFLSTCQVVRGLRGTNGKLEDILDDIFKRNNVQREEEASK